MKAVVLAGGQEFGQCPLSRQAPRALWPLADRPIIEHVLSALREAGIGEMAISANGRTHDIMDSLGHHPSPDVTIHYNEDCLPRGAAGCIKDCEEWLGDETFIVVHGACRRRGSPIRCGWRAPGTPPRTACTRCSALPRSGSGAARAGRGSAGSSASSPRGTAP